MVAGHPARRHRRGRAAHPFEARALRPVAALALPALVAVAAAGVYFAVSAAPARGTVLVLAAGREAVASGPRLEVRLERPGAGTALGTFGGAAPAAPDTREVGRASVPAGDYATVEVAGTGVPATVHVAAGEVTPVLLAVGSAGLLPGGVFAGNDAVNLALRELSGRLSQVPDFSLVDQLGMPISRASWLGAETLVAAFHTSCRETCPLYTQLFLQLSRKVGPGVRLVEVTTDPSIDTPPVLQAYAARVGAGWTFATGNPSQVASFWLPYGVTLSAADQHASTLVVIDRLGVQRDVFRGVPDVGGTLDTPLAGQVDDAGAAEVRSGGDRWSSSDVLRTLGTLGNLLGHQAAAGGPAPPFALQGFDGRRLALSDLASRPVVLNFFNSSCAPCVRELPVIEAAARDHPAVQFVVIDSADDPGSGWHALQAAGVRTPRVLMDPEGATQLAYGLPAVPGTAFIRTGGALSGRWVGELDSASLARNLSLLTGG